MRLKRPHVAMPDEVTISREEDAAAYVHIALEIPPGQPQIQHMRKSAQWVPRGAVLRCVLESGRDGEAVVCIDDHELTVREFSRLLATCAGWGMRITFVPDDELEREPRIDMREPEGDERWPEE